MSGNDRRKENFLETLLVEPDVRTAAKAAGISEATAYRWLADPDFSARYKEMRRKAFDTVIVRVQSIAAQAVETLRSVAADEAALPSSRVAAAKTILDISLKLREQDEFDSRLKVLEEKLVNREAIA